MRKITVGFVLLLAGLLAVAVIATPWALDSLAGLAVLATIVTIAGGSWAAWLYGREWRADRAAQRELLAAEADVKRAAAYATRAAVDFQVTTAAPGHQVYQIDRGRDVSKALHLSPTVHTNGHLPTVSEIEDRRWLINQTVHASGKLAAGAGAVPLIEAGPSRLPNVVDVMAKLDRILLVGGTGSGKTNTLKHYVAWLLSEGYNVAVIDPHSPSRLLGLDVIGAGLNWSQIADYFAYVMATVSARYQAGDIAQNGNLGPGRNQYLIIEEFYDIHDQLGEMAAEFLTCLLVRARKAGFRYTLVTQNDGAESLGLTGRSALLRTGTDRVEIKKNLQTGERSAVVGWKRSDQVECLAPSLFPEFPHVPAAQLVVDAPQYTEAQRAIIRAIVDNPGASKADIYRAAGVSKSGPNSRFIDEFLTLVGV